VAFNACSFWRIDALARIGERERARADFETLLACRNPAGLLSEDIDPRDGEPLGQLPADLFDGGHHPLRGPAVAFLAGGLVSRLVVVSNRVAIPGENAPGGLAVALQAALGERGGVWFGWSGKSVRGTSGNVHEQQDGGIRYITVDLSRADVDDYYNGFSNRTLWPLLHFRLEPGRLRPRHPRGLPTRQRAVRRYPGPAVARGRHRLDPRLPLDPAGRAAARTRRDLPDGLLPPRCRCPPADSDDGDTGPRTPVQHAVRLRPARLPDQPRQRPLPLLCPPVWRRQALDDHRVEAPDGRRIRTGAFPISIDTPRIARQAAAAAGKSALRNLHTSLERRLLAIGVDRLDYSKGLPERFRASDATSSATRTRKAA
jgi:trehalose 6-phosphate synthase